MKIFDYSSVPQSRGNNAQLVSDTESSNVFGQLLRSMEQDLWDQPSSGTRMGQPAPSQARHSRALTSALPTAQAAVSTRSQPALLKIPETREPLGSMHDALTVLTSRATTPSAGSEKQATPFVTAPHIEIMSPNLGVRREASSSPKRDTAGFPAILPPRYQPSTQEASPDALFRLTMTDAPGGLTLVLRTYTATADDLDHVEAQARHALQRYWLRGAKLLINGVPHPLTAPGDTTHGN